MRFSTNNTICQIRRIIFIASYPPRQCGIATFSQDLLTNMRLLLPHINFSVIALHETEKKRNYPKEVIYQISQNDEKSYRKAAELINLHAEDTLVVVQHEYGIYGGEWGEHLVELLNLIKCPIVTTLHTIVAEPDAKMRAVTEQIVARSNKLITLTDSSCKLFKSLYPSGAKKVTTIEHGIHPLLYTDSKDIKPKFKLSNKRVLLTFGLLSRNKGIEHVIRSLPKIIKQVPNVIYLVVGGTHPGIVQKEGESYREELMGLVDDLSLKKYVRFVPEYLPLENILEYLQAADIYIATSLDSHQAVSGTMSYALGAGRAVVSTNFSQAKEIITNEVGRVVPIGNPEAISAAVLELFADNEMLESMNHAAYAKTRSMLWSNIADNYIQYISEKDRGKAYINLGYYPAIKWDYLKALTDQFGLLQFSKHQQPDSGSGYTLDDNSRALQVVLFASQLQLLITNSTAEQLAKKYQSVIAACLKQSPPVNYLSVDIKPTHQNNYEDLSDSMARAYYALQTMRYADNDHTKAESLLRNIPDKVFNSAYIKTSAQLLLGAAYALSSGDESAKKTVLEQAAKLVDAYEVISTPEWHWFEETMTYANGQLCAAMLEAARATKSEKYKKIGLESLKFLCSACFMGDVYVPIGQSGWYSSRGGRALFDQQPEDAFSTLQALESAFRLTGEISYIKQARKVFSWYLGNNLTAQRLYDDMTGGCHDGLEKTGVNQNEGAESTLSYLAARLIIERFKRPELTFEDTFEINTGAANYRITATVK